jgi:hypothetical protein
VVELRTLLPEGTRIAVAAMRPRLCPLGGAIADGMLLNRMLPGQAARARDWMREGATQQGRTPPVVASYVRAAVGHGASRRLREEEGFYRTINEGHRKHFAAMEVPVGSVGSPASQRSDLLAALARTTPRSTFRSCASSRTPTRPCSAPLRRQQRRNTTVALIWGVVCHP